VEPTLIQQQLWSTLMTQQQQQSSASPSCRAVIGIAPTASGKTLSFAIPSLWLLLQQQQHSGLVVVLVPTKELVQQVAGVYRKLIPIVAKQQQQQQQHQQQQSPQQSRLTVMVVPIHGGVHRLKQVQALAHAKGQGLVVVATPGRLLDILEEITDDDDNSSNNSNSSQFSKSPWIILDEADQLTKEGDLGPQVDQILKRLIKGGKSSANTARLILTSATMSEKARNKFQEWIDMVGGEHALVQVDSRETTTSSQSTRVKKNDEIQDDTAPGGDGSQTATASPSTTTHNSSNKSLLSRIPSHLEQIVHVCSEHKKPRKLVHTLQSILQKKPDLKKGIVFYSKIEKLEYSCKLLRKQPGLHCLPLHGQLPTHKRQDNLRHFASNMAANSNDNNKDKQLTLLLATDVAARGVDIYDVDFCIQYDFASNLEQYVHRCGRAGRSQPQQRQCAVYSFFTRNMQCMASDLVQLLEASNAWVDPNLRALVVETDKQANDAAGQKTKRRDKSGTTTKTESRRSKKRKRVDNGTKGGGNDASHDDNLDEEDEFANLSANRIVLKRASHVSDASEDEDEEQEE
jgi:superfamily II DNA/RNA helicase